MEDKKLKAKLYAAKYYKNNTEKIKLRSKKQGEERRKDPVYNEKNKLVCKLWRQENRDKQIEYFKNRYEILKNDPEFKAKKKTYYLENKEYENKCCKERYEELKNTKEFKLKGKIKSQLYIQEIKKDPIRNERRLLYRRVWTLNQKTRNKSLNVKVIELIKRENINLHGILTCELCYKPIESNYHIDHFHPFSRKYEYKGNDINERNNLGISHPNCNETKNAKTREEWFENYLEVKI